jgi:hypothetical protein
LWEETVVAHREGPAPQRRRLEQRGHQGGAEGRVEAAKKGISEPHGTQMESLAESSGPDQGWWRPAPVAAHGEEEGGC